MGAFSRGFKYITRNKARSVLLVIVIIVLSLTLLFGFSFIKSVDSTMAEYKSSLGTSFSVIRDPLASEDSTYYYSDSNGDGLPEYMGPMLWFSDAENIMNSDDRIVKYNVRDYIDLIYSNLDLYPGSFSYFVNYATEIEEEYGDMSHEEYLELAKEDEIWSHITWFHPEVESELDRLFRIGAFELVKGRHIHKGDKNVALLSEYVAKANGLDIGDTFVPEQKEFLYGGESMDAFIGKPFPLEIIGIYKINFFYEPSENTAEIEIADNYIFTDFESEKTWKKDRREFKKEDRQGDRFDLDIIDFFVDNPENIDEVITSLEQSDVLDWQFYHTEENDEEYEVSISPINNTKSMITLLVILISAGCIIVLIMLVGINAKGRQKETNIYRSIGISKKSIINQRVFENILLSAIALAIAIILVISTAGIVGAFVFDNINDRTAKNNEFEVSSDANGLLVVEKNIKTELDIQGQIGFGDVIATITVTEGVVILATIVSVKKKREE